MEFSSKCTFGNRGLSMNTSHTPYPKILSVTPLESYHLRVTFRNRISKLYDCSGVLQESAFSLLPDKAVFRAVQIDQGGYGVFWNDEMDISESELWLHGEPINEEGDTSSYEHMNTAIFYTSRPP
jgi:hypothetical protein